MMKNTLRDRLAQEGEYEEKERTSAPRNYVENMKVNVRAKYTEQTEQEKDLYEEEDIDNDIFEETLIEEKKEKKERRKRKFFTALISIASIYIVMLIYGVSVTNFSYDSSGKIEPVVLTVDEIEKKQDFNVVLSMYLQARSIYERVLTLDYRVATGNEALEGIAPDYQETLEDVLTVATGINGTQCSAANQQIKNLIFTWLNVYMSDYCKYMITALSQNGTAEGESAGENAISCRSEYILPNFQTITQNVITIGSGVKGVNLSDITSWSPEDVSKQIQGIS